MTKRLPTHKEIDELVAFLPRLYAKGFSPIKRWRGMDGDPSGDLHLPEPEYDPVVREFIRVASAECWLDREYNPEEARQMLESEECIASANLAQVRTMLTYCVRGERFCSGHWSSAIKGGYIRRLLDRLTEIRGGQSR